MYRMKNYAAYYAALRIFATFLIWASKALNCDVQVHIFSLQQLIFKSVSTSNRKRL